MGLWARLNRLVILAGHAAVAGIATSAESGMAVGVRAAIYTGGLSIQPCQWIGRWRWRFHLLKVVDRGVAVQPVGAASGYGGGGGGGGGAGGGAAGGAGAGGYILISYIGGADRYTSGSGTWVAPT